MARRERTLSNLPYSFIGILPVYDFDAIRHPRKRARHDEIFDPNQTFCSLIVLLYMMYLTAVSDWSIDKKYYYILCTAMAIAGIPMEIEARSVREATSMEEALPSNQPR